MNMDEKNIPQLQGKLSLSMKEKQMDSVHSGIIQPVDLENSAGLLMRKPHPAGIKKVVDQNPGANFTTRSSTRRTLF